MFRRFLKSTCNFNQLKLTWIKKINGLIRVVIPDPKAHNKAYVVVYHEQKNKYVLNSFCLLSGDVDWSTEVPNGGYGAPAVIGDYVVILTGFTNIMAISKNNGEIDWTYQTHARIRSPINTANNKIYFSSGGDVFELSINGQLLNRWTYSGAFFYGSVDIFNELIISLGVISDNFGKSLVKVFAFHKNGQVAYELPIDHDLITSTDTSGIEWQKGIGFIGTDNRITAFQGTSGRLLWASPVEGAASRQVCSSDDSHVYYVTQLGNIGALNIKDGSQVWKIYSQDSLLVSPISLVGDKLIVPADAHLLVLKTSNGQLLQKVPIGHAPYSMFSLQGEYGIIGAGEPPHSGLMYAFKLVSQEIEARSYSCIAHISNANIENAFIDICVEICNIEEPVREVYLDGNNFYLPDEVKGEQITNSVFTFRVSIPKAIAPGDFVIPISIFLQSGSVITRSVAIKLTRRKPLPSKVYLSHIPDVVQEKPMYSGAAIAAVIKDACKQGSTSSQQEIREMVDAVRDLSGYEPFQTWRIVLRRVLTSQAKNTKELPEFASQSQETK